MISEERGRSGPAIRARDDASFCAAPAAKQARSDGPTRQVDIGPLQATSDSPVTMRSEKDRRRLSQPVWRPHARERARAPSLVEVASRVKEVVGCHLLVAVAQEEGLEHALVGEAHGLELRRRDEGAVQPAGRGGDKGGQPKARREEGRGGRTRWIASFSSGVTEMVLL